MWDAPVPVAPPKKRASGMLVTVIVVLAVLVCGGGATGLYFVFKPGANKAAGVTKPGGAAATNGAASTTPAPKETATGDAAGTSGGASDAKSGDCLANDGSDKTPKLRIVACGANTYEVIKRIEGTADRKKCSGTAGYTHDYYFDSVDDASDFVLCMKKR